TSTIKLIYAEHLSFSFNCASTLQNTNQNIPSYTTYIEDEDKTSISNNDFTNPTHLQF
ncbi:2397_t:CDS:1, partial [Dentiscutata heterogama]